MIRSWEIKIIAILDASVETEDQVIVSVPGEVHVSYLVGLVTVMALATAATRETVVRALAKENIVFEGVCLVEELLR